MQCSSEPAPEERPYETPPQALYGLAKQFRAKGERKAWRTALEYLVARYPNSRFARMAKEDLAELDGEEPAGDGSTEEVAERP